MAESLYSDLYTNAAVFFFFFLKPRIDCLDNDFCVFDRSVEGAAGLVGCNGPEQVCLIVQSTLDLVVF